MEVSEVSDKGEISDLGNKSILGNVGQTQKESNMVSAVLEFTDSLGIQHWSNHMRQEPGPKCGKDKATFWGGCMEKDLVLNLKDGKDWTDTEKIEGLGRKEERVHRAHTPETEATQQHLGMWQRAGSVCKMLVFTVKVCAKGG